MEKRIKINEVKEVAEHFASLIESLETEGDKGTKFELTYHGGSFEVDLTGTLYRKFESTSGYWISPDIETMTSQSIHDTELIGFINGGETVRITNAKQLYKSIEKLVNK